MQVDGRKVVVVGLGRSGVSAARLLLARGAAVVAADSAPLEALSAEARSLVDQGATLFTGGHPVEALRAADLVVVSPGVPAFAELAEVERSGREVIGEMELACRFVDAPVVLIGGTNGKSTTTALVHEMLTAAGKKAFIGGNFGVPAADATGEEWDVLVLEISSFQAERVPTLHARAHALLNVTDDHLDRYAGFADYARAKGNPFERMTVEDVAVVPADDPVALEQARRGAARLATFGEGAASLVAIVGGQIIDRMRNASYPIEEMRIRGRHNVANACAAIAVAADLGAPRAAIAAALRSFGGLGHRTAFVAEVDGVRFYDDSKGTNVGASVAALSGMVEPKTVLIAGGRDKLGAYEPLVAALRARGRALVVIGEAAERIATAAEGALPVARAGSMDEAVALARGFARPGDAVLLSPACSSFDMFRDYRHRGDEFVRAVRATLGSIEEVTS